ncbi:MAG: hypothetical protein K0Q74_600 [Gammaproteobacteria bacterium]|nr:hypothetical protein [Gammaproteobacteria bacterium]
MKKIFLTLCFVGGAAFSVNAHAALDCEQYTNKNLLEICKTLSSAMASAKAQDQAYFDKIMSSKKMSFKTQQTLTSGSRDVSTTTNVTNPRPQMPAEVSTMPARVAPNTRLEVPPTNVQTQSISPTYQYTPPSRVPNQPINTAPNAGSGQQNGKIKYY